MMAILRLISQPWNLCLQGIISPSTLGIDTKKLDNAEAQREKEKTTLYTRNAIVEALQETLPEVVSAAVNAYNILIGRPVEEVKVDIPFESMPTRLLKARWRPCRKQDREPL